MPRKPKKPQPQTEAPKNFDEFVDESIAGAASKLRDWRDVEKYKEERQLRRLVDDDLDLEDL